MESNQEDIIDKLSTVLNADESVVVSDTSDGDQDSQNSLLERLIKLVSSIVLHRPTSQLLKADVFPLEQVTTVSLCHVLPCAVSYMSGEEIRRSDAKSPLLHHEHW